MTPLILDFSAHSAWDTCHALWWEKYINKRRRRFPPGQRADAIALGSLVHEGLQVWQQSHRVEIPSRIVDELSPTRELLSQAEELIVGYTRAYPSELWPLVRCEEPVIFPLIPERLVGLAKIDTYFFVPEPTEIESGIPGISFTLSRGWWIHEYKTKAPSISMPLYMQGWEMGLQASYQLLALRHYTQTQFPEGEKVRGVLVNVLEKPRRHIPKRTCKQCREVYEFATWLPTGTGEYACPVCGNRQALQPLKQNVPLNPPTYYRICVERTVEELSRDRSMILQTGEEMIAMREGGLYSSPWNTKSCVDHSYWRACDFFGPHKNFSPTGDDPSYETPPDYRGLTQIEGVPNDNSPRSDSQREPHSLIPHDNRDNH